MHKPANPNDTQERAPYDRCVCGDPYWRHANGPCEVWTYARPVNPEQKDDLHLFQRCDCDGFTLAEDDI